MYSQYDCISTIAVGPVGQCTYGLVSQMTINMSVTRSTLVDAPSSSVCPKRQQPDQYRSSFAREWCGVVLAGDLCGRRPFISFTGVQQYFIILRWRPLLFQPALARSIEPAVIPELLEIFISTCLSCLREGGCSASGGPILLSAKKIIDSLTRP